MLTGELSLFCLDSADPLSIGDLALAHVGHRFCFFGGGVGVEPKAYFWLRAQGSQLRKGSHSTVGWVFCFDCG